MALAATATPCQYLLIDTVWQQPKQEQGNKEIKPHYIVDIGFMRVFVGLLGFVAFIG